MHSTHSTHIPQPQWRPKRTLGIKSLGPGRTWDSVTKKRITKEAQHACAATAMETDAHIELESR